MTSGFWKLPAELRLVVYENLLLSCLSEGAPADAVGLYSTCWLVRGEMEPWVTNALPFLQLVSDWNQVHKNPKSRFWRGPNPPFIPALHIYADSKLLSLDTNDPAHVAMDMTNESFNWILTKCAFYLPAGSLTLRIHPIKTLVGTWMRISHANIHCVQFSNYIFTARKRPQLHQQVKQYVMFLGTFKEEDDRNEDWLVRLMRNIDNNLCRGLPGQLERDHKSVWVAMTVVDGGEDWVMGFDFERGFKRPDRNVLKLIMNASSGVWELCAGSVQQQERKTFVRKPAPEPSED